MLFSNRQGQAFLSSSLTIFFYKSRCFWFWRFVVDAVVFNTYLNIIAIGNSSKVGELHSSIDAVWNIKIV